MAEDGSYSLQVNQGSKIILNRHSRVVLPRYVRLSSAFGLQYPLITSGLTLIECGSAFVLLFYSRLLSVPINAIAVGLCGLTLILILWAGVRIWSSRLLEDLVDILGEKEAVGCFVRSNIEVRAGVFPMLVIGLCPVAWYLFETGGLIAKLTDEEKVTIYCLIPVCTVNGIWLSAVVSGQIAIVRLVAGLLKCCVRQHFILLEAVFSAMLSREEKIQQLNEQCKRMKQLFVKANWCIIQQVFGAVIILYLVALVVILQIVVKLREVSREEHSSPPYFMLFTFGCVSFITLVVATTLLNSMTTVADTYEDAASDLSHNLELRFKITDTFAGPAGVKLLTSFETEHVNELSFNFHHLPLDRRVLEGTSTKLFLGAVVTVALGILTS